MKQLILSLLIILSIAYSCDEDQGTINLKNLRDTIRVPVRDTVRDTITRIVSQDSLDYVRTPSPILLLKIQPDAHPFVKEFDAFVDNRNLVSNVPFGVNLAKVKYTVQATPAAIKAGFVPVENTQFVNLSNAKHTFYFKKKFQYFGFEYTLQFRNLELDKPNNPIDSVIIKAIDNNTLREDIKLTTTEKIWRIKLDQRVTRETTFKTRVYTMNKVKEVVPSSTIDIDFSKANVTINVKYLDDKTISYKYEIAREVIEVVDLIFNVNGGNIMASRQYLKGVRPIKPADPVRTGYTFNGWFSDTGLTTAFDFSQVLNTDVVIHAKWTKN